MKIRGEKNQYFPFDPYNFHYLSKAAGTKPHLSDQRCATVAFRSIGPHLNYMLPTNSRVPQTYATSYLVCSMRVPEEIVFNKIVEQMMFRKRSRSWIKVAHNPKMVEGNPSLGKVGGHDPSAVELLALVAQCFIDPAASWSRLNPVRNAHHEVTLAELPLLSAGQLTVIGETKALPEQHEAGIWRRHESAVAVLLGAAQLEETLAFRTGLTVDECQAVLYELRQSLFNLHIDAAALGLSAYTYEFLGTFAVKGEIKNGNLQSTCALTHAFKRILRAHLQEWRQELGLSDDGNDDGTDDENGDGDDGDYEA